MNGLLYRGSRPVMWSPVEKTALAEAEVEYHEKSSPQIYVKFPVLAGPDSVKDASVVIWTTTPWTIPGNRAIAYSPTLAYGALRSDRGGARGACAKIGEKLLLADALAEQVAKHAKMQLKRVAGVDPDGAHVRAHPFHGGGYEFAVPLLPGEHVTADTGTGFVHTAPGHGEDDFELGAQIQDRDPVHRRRGRLVPRERAALRRQARAHAGRQGRRRQRRGDQGTDRPRRAARPRARCATNIRIPGAPRRPSSSARRRNGSSPSTSRSPARTTRRLRELALGAIAATRWYPRAGENRIGAMVRDRPDWVLSRQRAWGVPIAVFVHKKTGELLRDDAVNTRIADAFEAEGADAWFNSPPSRFLGDAQRRRLRAGHRHSRRLVRFRFDPCLRGRKPDRPISGRKKDRADLYLEGSDQHRGWFQSSLLGILRHARPRAL